MRTAKRVATVVIERSDLVRSFFDWVERDGKPMKAYFAPVRDKPEIVRLATDALAEMLEISCHSFDHWYLLNNYRYEKHREVDRRRVREAVRNFVADIQTGNFKLSEAGEDQESRA